MTRFATLFLIVALLAPATAATPPAEYENPFTGLFDPLWSLIDWAFFWLSTPDDLAPTANDGTISSHAVDKHGGFIVPNGVTPTPPPLDEHGGFLVPSG